MGKGLALIIAAIAVVGIAFYASGYRIVNTSSQPIVSGAGGSAKNQPGWRRSEETLSRAVPPGSGQQKRVAQAESQGGRQSGRTGRTGGGGGQQQAARQPGFGPSGGILLPNKPGVTATPVTLAGKEKASFIGQDLIDHVEDTVIATADGPRKGWSVEKTLKYLGIEQYKEAVLVGADGKKTVVSAAQIHDQQTIPLLTYNEKGQLMIVSGPKVRGTNKGMLTLEDVKKTVAGRTDLLNVSGIEKIEVKA
ncbi:MAG: hypothetical protein AB1515_10525 [Nitrospirota bacterium]